MQLYMLKDIARMSGHSIYTVKFYLKLGLIQEVGRSPETRFRYFDHSTIERLNQIRVLRKQKKRLAEIPRLLTTQEGSRLPGPPSAHAGAGKAHGSSSSASSLEPPASNDKLR